MLKKGLKMHHMVQKTPGPSGKAKICSTSIPGPTPPPKRSGGRTSGWRLPLFPFKLVSKLVSNVEVEMSQKRK